MATYVTKTDCSYYRYRNSDNSYPKVSGLRKGFVFESVGGPPDFWKIVGGQYDGFYIRKIDAIAGYVTEPPITPEPGVTLTHTIEVYSNGSIKVDGAYL